MFPPHRFFRYLRHLLRDLPPISPGRLLMPTVFLGVWTLLLAARLPAPRAFVWAGVLAEAAQLWGVLPVSVGMQRHVFGRAQPAVLWAVAILFGLMAFQIWWAEPWVNQRIVSVYCALYAGLMVLGIRGDRDILNRFVPVAEGTDVPLVFRRHLLTLRVMMCILIIVANEALLVVDAPLHARVATLALLPVVLHYFHEIALRLTCPPLDDGAS